MKPRPSIPGWNAIVELHDTPLYMRFFPNLTLPSRRRGGIIARRVDLNRSCPNRIVMAGCLRLTVVLGLILSSLPHALCSCGCAGLAGADEVRQRSERTCPHCCQGQADSEQPRPKPCECRTCQELKAVPVETAVAASSLTPTWWGFVSTDSIHFPGVPSDTAKRANRMGPPGFLTGPLAITLLLGRLLL